MQLGAYAIERDYSHYVAHTAKTVFAVVGTATKGTVGEAKACTSTQDFVNQFGPLNTECFGLYAGQYFLSQSSKLFFVRAASESLASASVGITGVDADSTDITNALVIEANDPGTYYNDYVLSILANEENEDNYDFYLRTPTGLLIDVVKDIAMTDLTTSYATKYFKVKSIDSTTATLTIGNYTFANGNDGISDITPADYIQAAQALIADTVDMNVFAIPGISDASVISAMLTLAESRGDCIFLVDPPKGLTKDGVIDWVDGGGSYLHTKFNSSFGAVYYDWVTIYDSYNKVQVQVPPSVVVAEVYAYSDRISELWIAPAGLTRGIVRGVINTQTKLNKTDVELLYEHNINALYTDPQIGLVLWGQKTLFRESTALDRVNVRRLMNYLKRIVVAACNYLVFEPNDRVTWNSFEMKVIPTLDNIKSRRGLYDYKVVRGESIVTDDDIDNYKMPCMIMVRPTKAAEEIPIYFVITSTGADFNEVLEANGVVIDNYN